MNFSNLPLSEPLLRAAREAGYEEPTPIQRETIPLALQGKDVLGCAQTGTGKTAAFALPILQFLGAQGPDGDRRPRALILTPTRELAIQIQENFELYGKYMPVKSCVVFGGVNQAGQVAQLKRGPQVLVATPGRLNDLIGQGYISLARVEIFVLDEADRMLDMGFIHDVKRIIAQLPAKRQTLFFSATMPAEVEKLAMGILHDPETVKVDPVSSTVDSIHQTLYMVDKVNKKFLLANLLKKPEVENALVFTRTKHGADRVVRELSRLGVESMAIHGDKSQNARQAAMSQFKSGKLKVLVATDIAARGIDVAGLSHVFNYDLPNEAEAYVHRIGRTGRAGLSGEAVSFCCIDEMKQLAAVEKLIGKKIPREESAWPMEVFTETVKQPRPPRPERVKDVDRHGNPVSLRKAQPVHQQGARQPSYAQPADRHSAPPRRQESRPAAPRAQERAARPFSAHPLEHPARPASPRPQGQTSRPAAPQAQERVSQAPSRSQERRPAPQHTPASTERRSAPQRKPRKFESR
ncbi:MAG: DEAD/DEAH box helicase [Eubacteriales bacterium]|nr:DEAD/DEAH box helicase [Eubacteriales bacterium]